MLHSFALLPLFTAVRAPADGTLGAGAVGTFELSPGAVTPDRLAAMPEASVLGRAAGAGLGPATALEASALHRIAESAAPLAVAQSRAALASSPAPAAAVAMRTLGHAFPGDGGEALWLRAEAAPAAGGVQSSDGVWWRPGEPFATPEAHGAAGDGAADDTVALQAAIDAASARGAIVLGRPGAVYRITSNLRIAGSLTLEGRSARLLIDAAGAPGLRVGGDAARTADVIVRGWRFGFPAASGFAICAVRVTDLLVADNHVDGGGLIETALPSDAPMISGSRADVSAFAEGPELALAPEAIFNHRVRITGNRCVGREDIKLGTDVPAAILLNVAWDWEVSGNHVRDYRNGIYWRAGGDADPSRDGGLGVTRWNRNGTVTGNVVLDCAKGGIWGGLGQGIAVAGNKVARCGDIGIHSENGRDIAISGNQVEDCDNGELGAFWSDENVVITGNSCVKNDAAAWGSEMFRWTSAGSGFDSDAATALVQVTGNSFIMRDASNGYGEIVLQAGGVCVLQDNTLWNVVIKAAPTFGSSRAFARRIVGNALFLTLPDGGDVTAIAVGNIGSTGTSGVVPFASIEGNRIDATGAILGAGSAAIEVIDATAADSLAAIQGNEAIGFPVFARTEARNGGGTKVTRLVRNQHDGAILCWDDGRALGATPSRHVHVDNIASGGLAAGSGSAAPVRGIFANGSRGWRDDPAGAGHAGWAAAAGPQGGGAAAGAWSPAGAYLRHDQVVASDGAIYVAAADGGEGQDPATDAASAHWRRVAATSVTFRDWGAVAP